MLLLLVQLSYVRLNGKKHGQTRASLTLRNADGEILGRWVFKVDVTRVREMGRGDPDRAFARVKVPPSPFTPKRPSYP